MIEPVRGRIKDTVRELIIDRDKERVEEEKMWER